nr:SDR family NAD(P)-dependent oxidoreductase [uncultured Arthrobacter sp.]
MHGKVALVTGAPRSIGRAIVESLSDDGASVVVHFRSRRDEADAAVAALRGRGAEAIANGGDLADGRNVAALFAETRAALGGIDIVVANAGATTAPAPVADISDKDFERLLSSNTRATFYVLRQAARTVRDGGRIINISSSSVQFAPAGYGAYATSKAGANTTIGVLANELGPRGITANSIMAGPIDAGFLDPSGDLVKGAPDGTIGASLRHRRHRRVPRLCRSRLDQRPGHPGQQRRERLIATRVGRPCRPGVGGGSEPSQRVAVRSRRGPGRSSPGPSPCSVQPSAWKVIRAAEE